MLQTSFRSSNAYSKHRIDFRAQGLLLRNLPGLKTPQRPAPWNTRWANRRPLRSRSALLGTNFPGRASTRDAQRPTNPAPQNRVLKQLALGAPEAVEIEVIDLRVAVSTPRSPAPEPSLMVLVVFGRKGGDGGCSWRGSSMHRPRGLSD